MPLAAQFKNNARTGLLAKLGRGRYAAPATIAKVRPAEPRTERALYLRWVRSVFELWTHVVLDRFDLAQSKRQDADPLLSVDWEELIDQSGFKGLLDRISTSIADRNQKYFTTIVKTPVPRIGAQSQMIEDFRDRNIALVKNLGQKQIEDLNATLATANARGLRHEEIRDQVKERLGVSESRAKLIARDQTLKYNSSVHTAQAKAAGISKFRWSTSHDGAVRPMHRKLDGEIFAYDDPPVTNDDGDRNLPGEDFQCRCVALPIIDLFEGIDDAPVFDPSVLNP